MRESGGQRPLQAGVSLFGLGEAAGPGQGGGVPVVRTALQPVRQCESALVVQFAESEFAQPKIASTTTRRCGPSWTNRSSAAHGICHAAKPASCPPVSCHSRTYLPDCASGLLSRHGWSARWRTCPGWASSRAAMSRSSAGCPLYGRSSTAMTCPLRASRLRTVMTTMPALLTGPHLSSRRRLAKSLSCHRTTAAPGPESHAAASMLAKPAGAGANMAIAAGLPGSGLQRRRRHHQAHAQAAIADPEAAGDQ